MDLKYGIIGTGAIGGFYGSFLAKAGKDVHFLLHSDYEYVKENGLTIDSIKGDFHLDNVNAYNSTETMPACDVIFVCLKTTSNHILNEILPHIIHERTVVVLIQNGLGFEKRLSNSFPDLSVAGALAFIASSKEGPGHIGHYDFGTLTIGSYQNENKAVMQQITDDFNGADVKCAYTDDLHLARWNKLLWNIPFNGVCVVLNAKTKELITNPASRQLVTDLMNEVVDAAQYCGVNMDRGGVEKMIQNTLKMKPYAPSMKLDFDYKRPMEIEAIYSNPVEEAKEAGFDMKYTATIEKQLRFIQEGYLGK